MAALTTALPDQGLSKTSAQRPLKEVLPKLSEKKAHDSISNYLFAACEHVGPAFMLAQIKLNQADIKAPKSLEALVAWVQRCAQEFGISVCDHHALIDLASEWVQNSNGAVRKSASLIFMELYKQVSIIWVASSTWASTLNFVHSS